MLNITDYGSINSAAASGSGGSTSAAAAAAASNLAAHERSLRRVLFWFKAVWCCIMGYVGFKLLSHALGFAHALLDYLAKEQFMDAFVQGAGAAGCVGGVVLVVYLVGVLNAYSEAVIEMGVLEAR